MFTRVLQQSMKRQEGQALILAALMMLVLALAVVTTVNLGHTVTERIRIQNTADAAAYSMAAMEARAFNFYAFANRTQVSHYVSAMIWQSILSFVYFSEAFFVDVYGLMKTINPCGNPTGKWKLLCPVLEAIPYVGPVIKAIDKVIAIYRKFVKNVVLPVLRTLDPDRIIGRLVIPAHRVLNSVMAAASTAVMYASLSHVTGTSNTVIAENDPNIDSMMSRALTGVLSACIFSRAHMKEANGNPLSPANPFSPLKPTELAENSKISRAKRVMGNITNATRFACDQDRGNCRPWVTHRSVTQLLPIPDWLGPIRALLELMPDWKWGQTKMLSHSFAHRNRDGQRNYIRHWQDPAGSPQAMLAQGDNMGSDDIYHLKIGPPGFGAGGFGLKNPFSCDRKEKPANCWGDNRKGLGDNNRSKLPFRNMVKTSIWAMNDDEQYRGGIHYRLAYTNPRWPQGQGWAAPAGQTNERDIGLNRIRWCVIGIAVCIFRIDKWTANVRGVQDNNHPWKGVVPFPNFEPGHYADQCGSSLSSSAPSITKAAARESEFNQPSSWVMLRKDAAQLKNPNADPSNPGSNKPALLNDTGTLEMKFGNTPSKLELDNTRKKFLGGEGLNVVSRAQTYYHRPGNWNEQPNFFNPYWRPRLASVWQGRDSLPFINNMVNVLPGPVKNIPQKIITH